MRVRDSFSQGNNNNYAILQLNIIYIYIMYYREYVSILIPIIIPLG